MILMTCSTVIIISESFADIILDCQVRTMPDVASNERQELLSFSIFKNKYILDTNPDYLSSPLLLETTLIQDIPV